MTYYTEITKDMLNSHKRYAKRLGVPSRQYGEFLSFINRYAEYYKETNVYWYPTESGRGYLTYGNTTKRKGIDDGDYVYVKINRKNIIGGKLL